MSRQDETLATGRLAGEALSGVVGVVRDIHAAIDARVEQHLPATARPVVAAQRGITAAVYAAVAAGHRVASRGAAAAVDAGGRRVGRVGRGTGGGAGGGGGHGHGGLRRLGAMGSAG